MYAKVLLNTYQNYFHENSTNGKRKSHVVINSDFTRRFVRCPHALNPLKNVSKLLLFYMSVRQTSSCTVFNHHVFLSLTFRSFVVCGLMLFVVRLHENTHCKSHRSWKVKLHFGSDTITRTVNYNNYTILYTLYTIRWHVIRYVIQIGSQWNCAWRSFVVLLERYKKNRQKLGFFNNYSRHLYDFVFLY